MLTGYEERVEIEAHINIHQSAAKTPSEVVIAARARMEEGDALDLPPLAEYIDPDYLNGLVSEESTLRELTFTWDGVLVRVSNESGEVTMRELPPE